MRVGHAQEKRTEIRDWIREIREEESEENEQRGPGLHFETTGLLRSINPPLLHFSADLQHAVLALGEQALLVGRNEAHKAIDRIGGRVLAAVVVAHLQFAQEADGKQLDAGDNEHRADDEHWAVVVHHVHVRIEDLHPEQNASPYRCR